MIGVLFDYSPAPAGAEGEVCDCGGESVIAAALAFFEMATFTPSAGTAAGVRVRVGITSTVYGADLLVALQREAPRPAGASPGAANEITADTMTDVVKYVLERPSDDATTLVPRRVGVVETASGGGIPNLGGA